MEPKKILRINGQDVELSGSGGNSATQGIADVTDFIVEYIRNESLSSVPDINTLFLEYGDSISSFGFESAEDFIKNANNLSIFLDYAAVLNAAGNPLYGESGFFKTIYMREMPDNPSDTMIFSKESLLLFNSNVDIAQLNTLLGEEVKYVILYSSTVGFLVGETRVHGTNLA